MNQEAFHFIHLFNKCLLRVYMVLCEVFGYICEIGSLIDTLVLFMVQSEGLSMYFLYTG